MENATKRGGGARPHGRRYPWDGWLARLPVTLRRGRDFECEPASLGINARLAARARGVPVRVHVNGESVTISHAEGGPASQD